MVTKKPKVVGKPNAQLLFLTQGKETEHAIDGLTGIHRMQRAKDQVSRLRRHERDFHCGAVAHFADENNFWRLAQRGAQSIWIVVEIMTELALIEGRF